MVPIFASLILSGNRTELKAGLSLRFSGVMEAALPNSNLMFLGISFFAIQQATKSSTKEWVVQGLWVSWIVLFFTVINLNLEWVQLHANIKFIPAFFLIGLHLYNMKYCQCESNECCETV